MASVGLEFRGTERRKNQSKTAVNRDGRRREGEGERGVDGAEEKDEEVGEEEESER
jgi:hypothetical protein